MAIANANEFDVRIVLKNDDLATWQSSSLVLEKGEIALAKVTVNSQDPITGNTVPVPTYLMKVGDGVNTFANLKWFTAPAADVYDWAKKSSLDPTDLPAIPGNKLGITIADNDEGKFVTGIAWSADTKTLTISRSNVAWSDIQDKPNLVNVITAEGDEEVSLTVDKSSGDVKITADHSEHAAGSAKTASDASISGHGATGSIKIPKIVTNEYGHVTEISEETVLITMPATPEEVVLPGADNADNEATTPNENTVAVVSGGTLSKEANNYKLTEDFVNVPTQKYVDEQIAAAKKYADDNDANDNTAHTHSAGAGIKLNGTENGGVDGDVKLDLNVELQLDNKTIKLVDATDKTKELATLDATSFIKDGMIKSVELVEEDDKGNNGQFLKITWNADGDPDEDGIAGDVVYLDVTTLVDTYTVEDTDTINMTLDNGKITAELKDGSVTRDKIDMELEIVLSKGENAVQGITQNPSDMSGTPAKKTFYYYKNETDQYIPVTLSVFADADDITNAINALDYTDTKVENQFVTAVSETDGKISVERRQATTDDIAQGTKVIVLNCGGAN